MQEQDRTDQEARKERELNALISYLDQNEKATADSLRAKMNELLGAQLTAYVISVSARRMQHHAS